MTVTAKDLRLKTSDILKHIQRVGGVTVTLGGTPVARLVSIRGAEPERDLADYPAVGIWADRKEMKTPLPGFAKSAGTVTSCVDLRHRCRQFECGTC
jgi:antitoxin (DNA-binding transcriptional repressor) of toxin-antitoxin stability system